jgi:short-subunit dehydrogenase
LRAFVLGMTKLMRGERSKSLGLALIGIGLTTVALTRTQRGRRGYSFTGRSVVITGGSRGLGLVLARQLAAEGAQLTLVARDVRELESAVRDIHGRYPDAAVAIAQADVGNTHEVEHVVADTVARFGRIDAVINNAGVIQVGPLDHMHESDYEDAMRTHFWGPLSFTRAVLPHMRRLGGGTIVNISSIGGRIAVPHMLPYSASKFALVGLSDGLRAELAQDNISVTTVCPGLMRIGSPVNASFKGRHEREFAWFAVASSLPFVTIGAERAAAQIIRAARRGDAELVITPQAKAAIIARTLVPELFSSVMATVHGVLPRPAGPEGDVAQPGRVAGAGWASSRALSPMRAAARNNNEWSNTKGTP